MLSGWLSKTTTSTERRKRASSAYVTWWKSPLPRNTSGASPVCGRSRSARRRHAKRRSSSRWRSAMVSTPSRGATEPSKSRTIGRVIRGGPPPVGLEPAFGAAQRAAQQRIARPHRVQRRREPRTELALDLRIGPPGDIRAEAVVEGVLEIPEPTDGVQMVRPRGRIVESDVLVDEHSVPLEAKVPSRHLAAGSVAEHRRVHPGAA